jgi:arsenical-resistance protein 2
MQDYLNEVGEQDLQALILTGGIKGWAKTYGGDLMDFYDEKVWTQQPS